MDEIKTFFRWIVSGLEHFLSSAGRAVVEYGGEFAQAIAANGGPLLIEAAKAGVLAAQAQGGSGEEKMNHALAAVQSSLVSHVPNLVIGIAKSVIENEVVKMKAANA